MATIQTKQDKVFPLDDVLISIANLDTSDLEDVQQKISLLLARRRSTSLQEQESVLLQKINNRLIPSVWQRYNVLHVKMQRETITPSEQIELLAIIDQIESTNVEWLKSIVELAQLRAVTPHQVMQQLGINPAYAKKDS